MGYKTEEEVAMNEELRDRFDKLDGHLEKQDGHLHEMSRSFQKHELDDTAMHSKIEVHLDEHERTRKFRAALWVAVVTGVIAAVGDLILHFMKH